MARPALEVADILRDHGAAWRDANRGHVMHVIERFEAGCLPRHRANMPAIVVRIDTS